MCFLKSFLLIYQETTLHSLRKYTTNFVSHWENKTYSSDIDITYFAGIQLLYKRKDITIGF